MLKCPLQVDTYYLHMPDQSTPIEGSLAGIQELYKEGKFKRVRQTPKYPCFEAVNLTSPHRSASPILEPPTSKISTTSKPQTTLSSPVTSKATKRRRPPYRSRSPFPSPQAQDQLFRILPHCRRLPCQELCIPTRKGRQRTFWSKLGSRRNVLQHVHEGEPIRCIG
jgi:hypothetical protein